MKARGWKAIGIDISSAAVSLVHMRNCTTVCGDLVALPFPDVELREVFGAGELTRVSWTN
jgi:hypothetical protein